MSKSIARRFDRQIQQNLDHYFPTRQSRAWLAKGVPAGIAGLGLLSLSSGMLSTLTSPAVWMMGAGVFGVSISSAWVMNHVLDKFPLHKSKASPDESSLHKPKASLDKSSLTYKLKASPEIADLHSEKQKCRRLDLSEHLLWQEMVYAKTISPMYAASLESIAEFAAPELESPHQGNSSTYRI